MRICVLTHTFPRNDKDIAAAFMKEFADGLTQNRHKVSVVAPFDKEFKRKNDPFKIYLYKYIWPAPLHILGYSKTMQADIGLKKRAYFLIPFMIFFGTLKLIYVVKKEKIELINVHWILPNGLIAFFASKLTNVPYVVTLPGTDTSIANNNKIFGLVAKIIALNAKGIVSNSSWLLNRIISLGIKNKLTAVISYSADISKFRPSIKGVEDLKKKLGISKKNFIVLAVGRLVYKKGFEYLIKAISLLPKNYSNICLVVVGEGDLKEELVKLSKKLKLSKKILFVGNINRDEIEIYYNMCDCFVAPSVVDKSGNADGGPLVALESMACGKPQIVTNILGVSDVIENGVNGFVIPPNKAQAITDSLVKLAKSSKLRKKMGERNRELVLSQLSTKKIGEKYTRFFEKVINLENVKY